MSDLVPLFSQGGVAASNPNSRLARQTHREVERQVARTEVAAVREQATAFLASQALTNTATLVSQAEAHMKIAPGGAQFYEQIISAYAMGAVSRISRF